MDTHLPASRTNSKSRNWLRLISCVSILRSILTIIPTHNTIFTHNRPREPDPVPENWRHATNMALDHLARKYSLDTVQRDLQGPNKRFPSFKQEFFQVITKHLG
jgi:hypothetical protein